MDGFLVLLLLGVLAIPAAVVALLIGQSRLKARVTLLELQLASLSTITTVPQTTDPAPPIAEAAPFLPAAVEPVPPHILAPHDEPTVVEPPPPPPVMAPKGQSPLTLWLQHNWIYAVSAASLALAGVFLVQYSVQNGLLPPLARVLGAYLLGAALIVAGEVLRRKQGDGEASATAYLPSVFAGAGLVTLFAATVAARQLYGLIGPGPAFGLLMATAALGVALGWFYGPLMVAVGLIGGFAAPFLVGSVAEPTPLLYGYFALIAATGLGVDAVRRWAWLSVLGLVLAYLGGAAMHLGGAGALEWTLLLLALPALAIAIPPLSLTPDQAGPTLLETVVSRGTAGTPPFPVRLVAGAVLASSVALLNLSGMTATEDLLCFAALALMGVTLLVWGAPARGLADLALIPGAAFWARLINEPLGSSPLASDFFAQSVAYRPAETAAPMTMTWLVAMASLLSAAFAWRALRGGELARVHGLAAVLMAPVAVALLEFVWTPAGVIGPWPWALHAMVLAAAMVALTASFAARDGEDHRRAAYATLSALSLIALALFVMTSTTALTLALAVLVVVAAALDRRYDLREMGLFIQLGAAVLSWRLLIDPGLDWAMQAPLLAMLVAFVGTIGAEVVAYLLLAGRGRVMTRGVLESAAMALTAVLANVLLSRWLVPFASLSGPSSLELNYAASLTALPWLVLALTQACRAQLSPTLRRLRQVLAVVAGVLAALGLAWSAIALNPLFQHSPDGTGTRVIGPAILNTLALSYALPGLILVNAARRAGFPRPLRLLLLATGGALLALYTGLEIRRFWRGDWLGMPGVTQYELYSYTIALMLAGAALLYLAIARRSPTLRRLAMAVIAVTVAKVFLLDASGLTGLTRVFSFLGLGLSLAGLAWLNRWAGRASGPPEAT